MKSKTKYFSLFAMITVLALTLTGCANNGQSIYQAPTSGPYAWIFSLFGKPIQNIMLAVEHQMELAGQLLSLPLLFSSLLCHFD